MDEAKATERGAVLPVPCTLYPEATERGAVLFPLGAPRLWWAELQLAVPEGKGSMAHPVSQSVSQSVSQLPTS